MIYNEFINYYTSLNKNANAKLGIDGKYHFLYVTRNVIDDKYYVGKHSTENLNDNYIGSGKYLAEAVNKYDSNNFHRTDLSFFDTSDEAFKEEEFIVTDEFIKLNNVYNLVKGGKGLSGGYWITNGKICMRVSESVELPEGFRYGRMNAFGSDFDRKVYHDPITKYQIRIPVDETPPEGYILGVATVYSYIHKFDENGNKITCWLDEGKELPEGWFHGCGPHKCTGTERYFDLKDPTKVLTFYPDDVVPPHLIQGQFTSWKLELLEVAKDQLARGYEAIDCREIAEKYNKDRWNVKAAINWLTYRNILPIDTKITTK